MAKTPQGILGGFRGRVANIVGASWKGIAYMRSLALSVANPNSAGQQVQRGKFEFTVKYARAVLADLITAFWNPIAQGMSGFNRFISQNIAAVSDVGVIDETQFRSTIGSLTGITGFGCTADDSANQITLTWTDNSGSGSALAGDLLIAAVYNVTQDYWVFSIDLEPRSDTTEIIGDATMVAGDNLLVFASFHRAGDNSICSNSTGVAVVVAA